MRLFCLDWSNYLSSSQSILSGKSGPIVKLNADHSGVCKFGLSPTDKANFKLLGKDSRCFSDKPPPSARLCRYYIPLPKNRQFTGREAILDEIRSKLFVKNECQRLAVVGLGGIGKTQVVLQLAYWVKETQRDYSIFWVPVMSYQTFEQAYTEIARRFDIPINKNDVDPKDSVRRYLESESAGKWLLIVDNADDTEVIFGKDGDRNSVYKYLPISDNGLILYTTRSRDVAFSVAANQVIDLQQLTYDEAETLLEKSMAPSIVARKEHMAELLAELCYIPLAITNAVAYLNTNQLPIRKYLDLLRGTEEDMVNMMTREFNDSSRYDGSQNAVATTWIVSFEKIAKSDPLAAQLLSFVSCIEPKAIPGSLLPSTGPKSNTESAIGTLCQYSFLVRRGESDTFDMHALVHLASRIWTQKLGCLPEIMTRAIDHLNEVFPDDDPENRELWREYLPHVLRALERSKEYQIQERYDLLYQTGSCLSADGIFKEAIKALEESRELFYKQLGNNHISASESNQGFEEINQKPLSKEAQTGLEIEHGLGCAYINNRQFQEAIVILKHVVAVREDTLAEEDNGRLASEHELARAYLYNQQVQEAIVILEHVVAVQKNTLAEEDNDRLASEHELARAYLYNQQVQEVILILEHIVAVDKYTVAKEDNDRFASKHTLARAYLNNQQVQKAIEILEHVVAVQKYTLAEENNDRLWSDESRRQ
ncbi:P-loop containing nucleoside triphosphate hydrolase protein [Nemania diffusa]|nr:P-loop containing nucleoside triphosphate hydrolase protein [Nemania diffusa]